VHWWNTKRSLEPIGNMPPDEFEAAWRARRENEPTGSTESADVVVGGVTTPDEAPVEDQLADAITY
jgi:hypothetical protein